MPWEVPLRRHGVNAIVIIRSCSGTHYPNIYIYIYIYIYHHHVVTLAWISLTLSRHFSLSFIASGRFSGLHPVSSHSYCMFELVVLLLLGHRSTPLMSSSLFLQQCPACLDRLTWRVFVVGGRWPKRWSLVGCCCQDLFNIVRKILV